MRARYFALASLLLVACGGRSSLDLGSDDAGKEGGSAPTDAAPPKDASPKDAMAEGGGAVDASAPMAPELLSQTGLYSDIEHGIISTDYQDYAPRFTLWSDGAKKTRWVRLPPGSQIDTTDMDHWSFPVGTRFFKEFDVNGAKVETRMIWRWGPGPTDFVFAPYQWNAAQTEAQLVLNGVVNANGTTHDIPHQAQCPICHSSLREHILGFGAMLLSHSNGTVTLDTLMAEDRLTAPPAGDFNVPGDPVAQAALGYLDVNCGGCHNLDDGHKFTTPYSLRLLTTETSLQDTGAYQTAVGVAPTEFVYPGIAMRIAPGHPEESAIVLRMSARRPPLQMPPLATKEADPTGVAAVVAWVLALGQDGGAPGTGPDGGTNAGPDGGVGADSGAVQDAGAEGGAGADSGAPEDARAEDAAQDGGLDGGAPDGAKDGSTGGG